MSAMPAYSNYWGKADPNYSGEPKWHPLAYHCLDVAAVAKELVEIRLTWLNHLSCCTGIAPERLMPWILFLLAVHDIGKFADGFQWQRSDLAAMLQARDAEAPQGERHDTIGYLLGTAHLLGWLGKDNQDPGLLDLLFPWLAAVTGHHGRPPHIGGNRTLLLRNGFPTTVLTDVRDFVDSMARLFLPGGWPLPESSDGLAELFWRSSWHLAGLAVVSDWMGSNTRWFPYCRSDKDLDTYWCERALPQARQAVAESGLAPPRIAAFGEIARLFPQISRPTPLQKWASATPLAGGPQLFVLEDLTGAGKTEAALTLTARMMEAGRGDGVFVALPTMATADAMFDRVRRGDCWRRFFTDENAQLSLAHSADRMKLRLEEANRTDAAYGSGENLTASRHCSAWLADSRKKALLADFGVGTLDQALLAVLPVRHQSLRLLGLSTKILVVDEVHACDCYMGELLARLLYFHAAQGGSAILLSATLPLSQRKRYIEAFAQGAGIKKGTPTNQAYPLATHLSAQELCECPLSPRADVSRIVGLECMQDEGAALPRLAFSIGAGRCAVWVRNTISDAVDAWKSWNALHRDRPAILFHARFALCDRLGIGKTIEDRFGSRSNAQTRSGCLVIATQVIEQSLDVDFDDMLTDLAPIDLIIQRAGRLQRHARDAAGNRLADGADGRGGPCLGVLMPEPVESAQSNWLPPHLKKSGMVYRDIGKLWLTARWLFSNREKGFALHEQAREMIESVYSEEAFDNLPEALKDISNRADGDCRAGRGAARNRLLDYAMGYNPVVPIWQDDAEAPTRLGEATVRVRLARATKRVLVPWAETGTGMEWQLSELTVPRRLIADSCEGDATIIDAARAGMFDEGRYCVIVPLVQESPDQWKGRARNDRNEVLARYSPISGLTISKGAEDESDQ
jgi:CRISPR-associated endonuclease/helicase Cas3